MSDSGIPASQKDLVRRYLPSGPTIKAFHESNDFVRGMMGPFGSGKSSACVMEILIRSMQQRPSPDGVRRTRWAVVRNSYPELKSTTIKTWAAWCPLHYGKTNFDSPIIHHVKSPEFDMEVLFLALDREEDVRKLLSLEVTGAWLNEVREIPKAIVDALTARVGRYPETDMGGATWSGLIMDTNPPDDQSWYYACAEGDTPQGWRFFKQPSGLADDAENVTHLPKNYYKRLSAGKDADWIKVYVQGEYGFVNEGKAVFPMFRDRIHVAETVVPPVRGLPILIGADFGLTPAAPLAQRLSDGRWVIFDELTTEDCGIVRFAEILAKYVAEKYPEFTVSCGFGDPAGNQRFGDTERTALEIMREYTGWKWLPAPSQDPSMRREVVIHALNRMIDGNPGFLVSPNCQVLRKALNGGYHYKAIRTGFGQTYHDQPNKNQYSHIAEAVEYLLLGGGEHQVVLNKVRRPRGVGRSFQAKDMDYSVFDEG